MSRSLGMGAKFEEESDKMPHYRNGKPARIGDLVLAKSSGNQSTLGIVTSISCESCNGTIMPLAKNLETGVVWMPVSHLYEHTITLKDAELMVTESTTTVAETPETMTQAVGVGT